MKIWSATVLLVISIGCTASSIPVTGDPVAEVRAVWTKQVDAWNRGDLEGFMAGYWKSPDLVFFSNGSETRGWQETLDRYRASYKAEGRQMGTLDFPQLEFKELSATVVLARGTWRLKMPDGKESTGMTSVTFQQLPEGWRIVHDHSSAAVTALDRPSGVSVQ
jgi:beta-aspartyl-peptidase (threonine type)